MQHAISSLYQILYFQVAQMGWVTPSDGELLWQMVTQSVQHLDTKLLLLFN